MGILDKLKKAAKGFAERRKARIDAAATEKAIAGAAREIERENPYAEDQKKPGLIDVASVYRKGRYRRKDIRKTQRSFRARRQKLILINRPGNIVFQLERKGFISNKGRFIPFATLAVPE